MKYYWILILFCCCYKLEAQKYYGGSGSGYQTLSVESFMAGGNPNAKYAGGNGSGVHSGSVETFLSGGNPNGRYVGGTGTGCVTRLTSDQFLNGANANARFFGGNGTGYQFAFTETFLSGGNPNARFFGGSGNGYRAFESQFAQVLPVVLTEFDAQRVYDRVELEWATVQEIDNRKFVVQRSTDMVEVDVIVEVAGIGKSSTLKRYKAFDEHPLQGVSYYRLKQIDNNGMTFYSRWVVVEQQKAIREAFAISPNPNNGSFKIDAPFTFSEITLYDMSGIVMEKHSVSETNQFSFEGIVSGLYFVSIQTPDGNIKTAKVYVY